jgi:hypothetical protein
MKTNTRTNSATNPVTVKDLHAGLHNTLRGFFHGKIDESTVTHRSRVMVQVEWSDGKRAKYRPEELFYEPQPKEKQ